MTTKTHTPRDLGDGYTATKRETHRAYPRNGNVHNPTIYYVWEVARPDGRNIGRERTLAGARELKTMDLEEI